MQLSTLSTQVIPIVSTIAGVLGGIIAGACAYYVARELRALKSLRLDVAEVFERVEALTERFTRFQKREGMREARKEKTSQGDLLEEARALVAQGAAPIGGAGQPASGRMGKAELYRRRFNA